MSRADTTELSATLREIIGEFAYLDDEMTNDDPLHLDSLHIAELLVVVEDRFGPEVAAGFTQPDIRTINSIARAIARGQEPG